MPINTYLNASKPFNNHYNLDSDSVWGTLAVCDSCCRTAIVSDSLLQSHSLHHSIVSLVLIYMRGGAIRLRWRCSVMQLVSVGSRSVVGGRV